MSHCRASIRSRLIGAALALGLSAASYPASSPGLSWQARVSGELQQLYHAEQSGTPAEHVAQFTISGRPAHRDAVGRVQVDVRLQCDAPAPAAALTAAGLRLGTSLHLPPYCITEGWIAAAQLPALSAVPAVQRIELPHYATRRAPPATGTAGGTAASTPLTSAASAPQASGTPAIDGNGVTIMRADQYITQTTVNGAGVTVGVISDDATSLALIQGRGELPAAVPNYTPSGVTYSKPTDEGTMMLEEVHAVAPGAGLAFCGPVTDVEYVTCVNSLISHGATLIVDDLAWPTEDMMAASSVIAVGVQNAVSANPMAAFFTSAGNFNGAYWEGTYQPVSLSSLGAPSFTCNAQTDNYIESFAGHNLLGMGISGTATDTLLMQWADPWNGNLSNFDLYIKNANTGATIACANASTARATLLMLQASLAQGTYAIYIATPDASLAGKFLKLYPNGSNSPVFGLYTSGSVLSPQAQVQGVVSVGAVLGSDGIGGSIENYSSRGPLSLPLPTAVTVQVPFVVAPDAIAVDAVGTDFVSELWTTDGDFHGTSAAAPNAAAVAALLRSAFPSLTAAQLTSALADGATQLGPTLPDSTYGYGRVDALGALGSLPAPSISGFPNSTVVGGTSTPAYPLTVSGTGALQFSVQSTTASLLPASVVPAGSPGVTVSPAGCGSSTGSCTITLRPALGKVGSTSVTLTVTDGAHRKASATALISVTLPAAPSVTIASGATQSLSAGASPVPLSVSLTGTAPLQVRATSSNSALIPSVTLSSGCGSTALRCTATLARTASSSGDATITLTATDAYAQSASAQATISAAAATGVPAGGGGGGGGAIDILTLALLSLALRPPRSAATLCASAGEARRAGF